MVCKIVLYVNNTNCYCYMFRCDKGSKINIKVSYIPEK